MSKTSSVWQQTNNQINITRYLTQIIYYDDDNNNDYARSEPMHGRQEYYGSTM